MEESVFDTGVEITPFRNVRILAHTGVISDKHVANLKWEGNFSVHLILCNYRGSPCSVLVESLVFDVVLLQWTLKKCLEDLTERISLAQASIFDFQRQMRLMKEQMEGLIGAVQQFTAHIWMGD